MNCAVASEALIVLLSSCFRGINLDFFYETAVFVDGSSTAAHSMAIIMASGEDTTNRCPPIDMSTPHRAVAPGAYVKYVYPHGQVAGVVMPPQPQGNIPNGDGGNNTEGLTIPTQLIEEGGGCGSCGAPSNTQIHCNAYGSGGLYGSAAGVSQGGDGGDGMMYSFPLENINSNKKSIYDECGPSNSNIIPFGVVFASEQLYY